MTGFRKRPRRAKGATATHGQSGGGLRAPGEKQRERDRRVEDAACVAVEDGSDGEEREAKRR